MGGGLRLLVVEPGVMSFVHGQVSDQLHDSYRVLEFLLAQDGWLVWGLMMGRLLQLLGHDCSSSFVYACDVRWVLEKGVCGCGVENWELLQCHHVASLPYKCRNHSRLLLLRYLDFQTGWMAVELIGTVGGCVCFEWGVLRLA